VVHLHDVLGWWDGHHQPFALDEILALAEADRAAALARVHDGRAPTGCDLRAALGPLRARTLAEDLWAWPFAEGATYLVHGLVAAAAQPASTRAAPGSA
jgi:hypothetical protein